MQQSRFGITALMLMSLLLNTIGQDIAIGQWRDHLPYHSVNRIEDTGNKIWCATGFGLFSFNKSDNSLERLSKVNGLSDLEVSTIGYDPSRDLLLIAYRNANLDLLENGLVFNISDIKRKQIPGNKSINSVFFMDNYAYLATGFGIVVLDVTRREIRDTYIIGPNGSQVEVYQVTSDGAYLYAATAAGIYQAPKDDPNLVNFAVWTKHTSGLAQPDAKYNLITMFNGKVYANKWGDKNGNTDTVVVYDGASWTYFNTSASWTTRALEVHNGRLYLTNYFSIEVYDQNQVRTDLLFGYAPDVQPVHAVPGADGVTWIADRNYGLVKFTDPSTHAYIFPNGPKTNNVVSMTFDNGTLWTSTGGVNDSWGNLWRTEGIAAYDNKAWRMVDKTVTTGMDTLFDLLDVAIDPANGSHFFAGLWGHGVAEFLNDQLVKVYDNSNSSLQVTGGGTYFWIGVGGMTYDDAGNLWVTNSGVTEPLSVRMADGTWRSFNLGPLLNLNHVPGDLIISRLGHKWMLVPRGLTKGVFAFDDNGTPDNTSDDRMAFIRGGEGQGNLPTEEVLSIAEDRDGEIWIGTTQGPVVCYTPELVFDGGCETQRILVERDGFTEYLLDGTAITAILVDGANRKWIGTQTAGVFLLSPDGTKEISHFTEDNSPLLANHITSIAINHFSGEIFFGTSKGIVSYRAEATKGGDEFADVLVYPNPVRENYNGPIAIRGLVTDASVKITDISGSLVYETKAFGGQAIWNGNDFEGNRAASGVYMVFCSNTDGSETYITKILLINGR